MNKLLWFDSIVCSVIGAGGSLMHNVQGIRKGNQVRPERYRRAARMFFSAADPARLKALLFLAGRMEACVTDLAESLDMSTAAVSHHLQILRECRCLKTVRTGRMVCYQFVPNEFTVFVIKVLKRIRMNTRIPLPQDRGKGMNKERR